MNLPSSSDYKQHIGMHDDDRRQRTADWNTWARPLPSVADYFDLLGFTPDELARYQACVAGECECGPDDYCHWPEAKIN